MVAILTKPIVLSALMIGVIYYSVYHFLTQSVRLHYRYLLMESFLEPVPGLATWQRLEKVMPDWQFSSVGNQAMVLKLYFLWRRTWHDVLLRVRRAQMDDPLGQLA